MSINSTITVNITADAPAIDTTNFGTPLFIAAAGSLGVGFTQRVRYYDTTAAIATDEASGDITAVVANALRQALSQAPRVSRVGVGRIDALVSPGDLTAELNAIVAEDNTWFAATFDPADASLTDTFLEDDAAPFASANEKLFLIQQDNAAWIDGTTPNLPEDVAATNNGFVSFWYHDDDTDYVALALLAKALQANPDIVTTIFAHKTLTGSTPYAITATERSNAEADSVNYYTTLLGTGSTWPGKTSDGEWIDVRISIQWFKARLQEGVASVLLQASNRNSKIPYSNAGAGTIGGVVRDVYRRGVAANHVLPETLTLNVPLVSDLTPAQRAARELPISFSATLAGAIQSVDIVGALTLSL